MTETNDNMSEIETSRQKCAKIFIFVTFAMYVLMMASKNIFTAELVTLMDVFQTTKAETSLAMTYYFITYAIGQFALSFVMGKINLRLYLTVTSGFSAILTIFLGFMPSMQMLYVLCGVNGVLQAGIYSGCMASFSKYLPANMLSFSNKMMTVGTASWGILSYGIPPLFVGQGLWNVPFILLGVLFLISVVLFFIAFNRLRKYPIDTKNPQITSATVEKPYFKLNDKKEIIIYFAGMIFIALLGNTIHYTIINWIPNMLYDVWKIPQSYSILITLIVPLISAIGAVAAINLCQNKKRNIFTISVIFRVCSTLALLPLIYLFDQNMVVSIALLVVFATFGSGSVSILMGVLALKMRSQINTGSYLAAVNAVAAVTAGVVPPLAGKIIDSAGVQGYGISYLISFSIGIITIFSIGIFAIWYRKKKEKEQQEEI